MNFLKFIKRKDHNSTNIGTTIIDDDVKTHDQIQQNIDDNVKVHDPIEQNSELLNKLDDDCLRGIFKYLTFVDLLNAADVCIRFKQHANDAFNAKFQKSIKIDENFELNGKINETEAMLRNFGPLIHSLSIISTWNNGSTATAAARMINQHTTLQLKELHMTGIDLSEYTENLCPVFAKLEKFELYRCTFSHENEKIFHQASPMLNEAHFKKCTGLKCSMFEKFIELNPQLKILTIRGHEMSVRENSIELIGNHLSKLVHLEITAFTLNLKSKKCTNSLSKLSALKVLKLECTRDSIAPLLKKLFKNNIPIEHLDLNSCKFDDSIIKMMSQLKQIKILGLNDCANLTESYIIELAKALPLLEEFHIVLFHDQIRGRFRVDSRQLMAALSKLPSKNTNYTIMRFPVKIVKRLPFERYLGIYKKRYTAR